MAITHKKDKIIIHSYLWQGINRKGKKVTGEYKSKNEKDVKAFLRRQDINLTRLKKKPLPFIKLGSAYKVTSMDIAIISRQLATMLSAGVPLVQSISIVAEGHEKAKVKELLENINSKIQSGSPVADAFRPHYEYFDDLYCDLIAVGEISGSLDHIYDRIAIYKEKTEVIKSKIKKAMLYPISVIIIALTITILLLIFVVPQFESIFKNFGAELPVFTQLALSVSKVIQNYWHIILGAIILASMLFKKAYISSIHIRNKVEVLLLRIPIIGKILHKSCIARFSRTLATTISSGIPLLEALKSSAGASGNYIYRTEILSIRREVESGLLLNMAMRTSDVFPSMLIQMIMIGEEAGTLDSMLNKVANIYEIQVDDAVDGLTTLIEPLIMVIIGIIIGSLIIAMYLPIFKMGSIM